MSNHSTDTKRRKSKKARGTCAKEQNRTQARDATKLFQSSRALLSTKLASLIEPLSCLCVRIYLAVSLEAFRCCKTQNTNPKWNV